MLLRFLKKSLTQLIVSISLRIRLPRRSLLAMTVRAVACGSLVLQDLDHGGDVFRLGVGGNGVSGRGEVAAVLADFFQ